MSGSTVEMVRDRQYRQKMHACADMLPEPAPSEVKALVCYTMEQDDRIAELEAIRKAALDLDDALCEFGPTVHISESVQALHDVLHHNNQRG